MDFMDSFFGADVSPPDAKAAAYVEPLKQRNYAAAVPLLQSAMAREDALAMGLFGALCALGRGVDKNPEDACAWFRQAANRGHVPSQAALGMCLAGGQGSPADYGEAAYWLYRAGKAGNLHAIEVLGNLAMKDNSIVGKHFSEDELCDLVLQLRKRPHLVRSTPANSLH